MRTAIKRCSQQSDEYYTESKNTQAIWSTDSLLQSSTGNMLMAVWHHLYPVLIVCEIQPNTSATQIWGERVRRLSYDSDVFIMICIVSASSDEIISWTETWVSGWNALNGLHIVLAYSSTITKIDGKYERDITPHGASSWGAKYTHKDSQNYKVPLETVSRISWARVLVSLRIL